ncbi:glycosyltransferase [Sinirhodobacter sp. WL0062]|uniref:Glycosyltransferase n=1 Tax=Rhodobacter flavimaris TaxID=2907145 RepID=A0ABS8YX07_9RHOB|nr:glycosyltransferase [Sinirhodobacter sp. WL0062]MCE5974339.1 glycosyltransferase [Sinirhodobacter sp. WL0062]
MKILVLHNAYRQRGGEDAVVEAEIALLRRAGHEVHLHHVSNQQIDGVGARFGALVRVAHNRDAARQVAGLVRETQAQIVHVHNFFPLLSPAVHGAARQAGAAVVQTLHNYRLLCANAMFLRDGKPCTDCLEGSRTTALVHRCYRGSLPGSATLMAMQRATRGDWQEQIDRFIVLTRFSREIFVRGGLPADRLFVKPNFVARADIPPANAREGALFVGRLSPEKGVASLIAAWRSIPEIPLTVIGSGPLDAALRSAAPGNVTFIGPLPRDAVLQRMAQARLLVFPSIWYEGFPMTLVEAMAAGLPIVAARIGAAAEIVTPELGALFTPGDTQDLANKVREVHGADPGPLSAAARRQYELAYTDDTNLALLERCYAEALERRRRSDGQGLKLGTAQALGEEPGGPDLGGACASPHPRHREVQPVKRG